MKKLLMGFLLFLLILSPAYAGSLYQYSVKSEISSDNTVHSIVNLVLANKSAGEFNYLIEGEPANIQYNSTGYCKIQDRILGKELICDFNTFQESTVISVSYDEFDKISEKNGYLLYRGSFKMPYDVRSFSCLVKIPEGYGLLQTDDAYSPTGATLGSDGRRSILVWNMENLAKNQDFEASVAYETMFGSNYSFLIVPGIIIIFLIGIIIFLKKRHIKIILPILKSDEKKVFEAVAKLGSGTRQKKIVEESGYSKAKVSKVLKNLQERGILRLERIGRTNKVHIEKKLKSKD